VSCSDAINFAFVIPEGRSQGSRAHEDEANQRLFINSHKREHIYIYIYTKPHVYINSLPSLERDIFLSTTILGLTGYPDLENKRIGAKILYRYDNLYLSCAYLTDLSNKQHNAYFSTKGREEFLLAKSPQAGPGPSQAGLPKPTVKGTPI